MATCLATQSALVSGWALELAFLMPKATVSGRVTETRMGSETGLVAAWGPPNRLAWVQKRSWGSFRSAKAS
jgi:hypothetical protein